MIIERLKSNETKIYKGKIFSTIGYNQFLKNIKTNTTVNFSVQ